MIDWTQTTPDPAHFQAPRRLDAPMSSQLHPAFDAVQAGLKQLYVSMGAVSFMDFSGLAAMVSGLKTARQHGGELYIVAPSAVVQQVLGLRLLNQVIPSRDTPGLS